MGSILFHLTWILVLTGVMMMKRVSNIFFIILINHQELCCPVHNWIEDTSCNSRYTSTAEREFC